MVVGRRRRRGGDRVQRRRVHHRGLLGEPVRRAGGRVRRVPGDVLVSPDRVQPQQRVGADPADQLQRQLRRQRPDRRRDLLPLAAGPADRADPVPGRDRRRGSGPDRPARPGRRPVAAPRRRTRHPRRRGVGRERRQDGQHRPGISAGRGHPRPARRRERRADYLHSGLRPRRRGPGVREPGLPPISAGRDRRAGAGACRGERPARRADPCQPGRRVLSQRRRRSSPADIVWQPSVGAPPATRPAQHARTVRRLRGARGHDIVRGPDAAAVRPRLRGRGQRHRQPGAAGCAGSAAASGRDSVRRAARADSRHRELPGIRAGSSDRAGLRSGPAARRRAGRGPARLARRSPGRAAGRRLTLQDLP